MKKYSLFLFIILFSSSIIEARQVTAYNLNVGDTYTITSDAEVNIDQMVFGQASTTVQKSGGTEKIEIIEKEGNVFTIQVTVISLTGELAGSIGSQSMSSEGDALADLPMKVQKGAMYSFTMDDKGNILEINGLEEIRNKIKTGLAGTSMAMAAKEVAKAYSDENIKSQWKIRFSIYPEEPADTWTISGDYMLNNFPAELTTWFEISGENQITSNSELTLNGAGSFNGISLESNLIGGQTAEITVDSESGIPLSIESENKIEGTVTTQGMSIPMTINSTGKITIQKN